MSLEKAIITNTVTGDKIPVMFNPEEYTINREINYAQATIPGLSAPILQFVAGNMQTLDMELFIDTYEEHRLGTKVLNRRGEDVRRLSRLITDLMNIEPTTHKPPVLLFIWASLAFTCVLAKVNQRFIMFLPDGTPVRARLQVSFHEFRNVDLEAKEIKRETADFTKRYIVGEGENLSDIASKIYGDPRLWRVIALRNGLNRPRSLAVGLTLLTPRLPYRDPESGKVYD